MTSSSRIGEWAPAFLAPSHSLLVLCEKDLLPGLSLLLCPSHSVSCLIHWTAWSHGPFLSSAAQLPSGMTEKEARELVKGREAAFRHLFLLHFSLFPCVDIYSLVLFLC